jgi:hypothetical protein
MLVPLENVVQPVQSDYELLARVVQHDIELLKRQCFSGCSADQAFLGIFDSPWQIDHSGGCQISAEQAITMHFSTSLERLGIPDLTTEQRDGLMKTVLARMQQII